MAGSEGVRSKASRYKRFVLHRPDSQRLNETFVTQAQVRVEGIPDLPSVQPAPTPTRLEEGRVRSSQVSQVELDTARPGSGRKREEACPSCWGVELLGVSGGVSGCLEGKKWLFRNGEGDCKGEGALLGPPGEQYLRPQLLAQCPLGGDRGYSAWGLRFLQVLSLGFGGPRERKRRTKGF